MFALNLHRRYKRRARFAGGHQIFTTRKRRRFSLTQSKGHAFCIQVRSSQHSDAATEHNIATAESRLASARGRLSLS